jgi:serine/threonine protein kinase
MKVGLGRCVDGSGRVRSGPAPESEVAFDPPSVEELAAHFPQLEIVELMGRGGMGAVYRARQRNLDREVALKILPPALARRSGFAERFACEAKALAKLNHRHIVAVYEFGQAEDLFYFVMELIDGVSLRQLLTSGRLAPKEALAIVPQICEALQFAHEHGIVHRDIKPGNILLTRQGEVKITDFGIAKLAAADLAQSPATEAMARKPKELTTTEGVLGTPQYMAPEQADRSCEVDHRADIYSLGVVFYEMLTGELPTGKLERPSEKVLIDVRLDEVVLRALAAKPERRYQEAGEMQREVETITGSWQTHPSAWQRPRWPRGLRTAVRRWWLWLLLAGIFSVAFWLAPGSGVRVSGVRNAQIEVLDLRFDPVSAGKNILHLTVFNRFPTHKTLAVHIQTDSQSPGEAPVGWGRPYFVELNPGATLTTRLPFKLFLSPANSEITLTFYALGSAEDYVLGGIFGKKRTYRGAALEQRSVLSSPLAAASEDEARAAGNVLSLLRSSLQEAQYTEAMELFTKDCLQLEQIESLDRLSDWSRADTGDSVWASVRSLGCQPGKVLAGRGFLRLEAQCEDAVWTILLAQESGQWKIDSIGRDPVRLAPSRSASARQ